MQPVMGEAEESHTHLCDRGLVAEEAELGIAEISDQLAVFALEVLIEDEQNTGVRISYAQFPEAHGLLARGAFVLRCSSGARRQGLDHQNSLKG